jgi:hypothetical protein
LSGKGLRTHYREGPVASKVAVVKALAVLSTVWSREITAATVDAYVIGWHDLSDADLASGVELYLRSGKFWPSPGEVSALVTVPAPELVDTDSLLASIERLGTYGPSGWCYPRVALVRDTYGEAVATAYAVAGASRLFSESVQSRDVARGEFARMLRDEMRPGADRSRLSPPPHVVPALPASVDTGPVWGETIASPDDVAAIRAQVAASFRAAGLLRGGLSG